MTKKLYKENYKVIIFIRFSLYIIFFPSWKEIVSLINWGTKDI